VSTVMTGVTGEAIAGLSQFGGGGNQIHEQSMTLPTRDLPKSAGMSKGLGGNLRLALGAEATAFWAAILAALFNGRAYACFFRGP